MTLRVLRTVAVLLAVLLPALAGPAPGPLAADEGWLIQSFDAQIDVEEGGDLDIVETISVDFGAQQKHGIFRDIPVVYDFDARNVRVYDVDVVSVNDLQGAAHRFTTARIEGGIFRIQIGDPNRTISGRVSYIIHYRVAGALNGFPEHDELYWNATGTWPVTTTQAGVTVRLPGSGVQRVDCFQGSTGSTDTCLANRGTNGATFRTARPLGERHQLTVVVGFDKGLVASPLPRLERRPPGVLDLFTATPATLAGATLVGVLALLALIWAWWTNGRDRRYTSIYYLSDNPAEETRPLLAGDPIVVEFEPPEQLRPGQAGLLLDERADTLDATATIVDLAVRGYLRIIEEKKEGLLGFSSTTWRFERTDNPAGDLLPYEARLLIGLFAAGDQVTLDQLKQKYYTHLAAGVGLLYQDARDRGWFPDRPDRIRTRWVWTGLGVALVAGALSYTLGTLLGAGLVTAPLVAAGGLLAAGATWMPRRTAAGSELLRRVLGFRNYVAAAETHRQAFNEQRNIFASYLPYAMVFGCVDKWAKALESLDLPPQEQGWYVGSTPFHGVAFSNSMRGMASEFSSAITSTPGGSGGSGFSGGSAGGGGGGGGGGSW